MAFNWIKGDSISINSILLMDEFIIGEILFSDRGQEFKNNLSWVLKKYPSIAWYMGEKQPKGRELINEMINSVDGEISDEDLRKKEIGVIEELDCHIVYIYPEMMEKLDYITGWDEERLLELVDFKGKRVLDLGSGTGRLGFVAAKEAHSVYACEPAGALRDHLRKKKKELNVKNLHVVDGMIEDIPFQDDFFDVIVAGHVIGDDYENEYRELKRVLKSGGYIVDCPGEDHRKKTGHSKEMEELGFSWNHYVSKFGGDVYRYWKKVDK